MRVGFGGLMTSRLVALTAVPSMVVTLSLPVTAANGTRISIVVDEFDSTNAGVSTSAPTLMIGVPVSALRLVPEIVTTVLLLAAALAGLNPVILGATLKIPTLVPVSAGLVTLSLPVTAPSGTTAFTCAAVTTVGAVDALPPKVTTVVPAKKVPLSVTILPTGAAAGVNDVIFGGLITTRSTALSAVPSIVVTLIFAVTAASGTVNWIVVEVFASTVANGSVNAPILIVVGPLAARRFRPVIVTTAPLPATTLGGLNPRIFGTTLKAMVLAPVPAGVVTLTGPVCAPAGTVTLSEVAVTAVAVTDTGPENSTDVAPMRLTPVIVIVSPTRPVAGTNPVGLGGLNTIKSVALVEVPSIVVTLIRPVDTVLGTWNCTIVAVAVGTREVGTTRVPIFTTGEPVAACRLVPVIVTTVELPATAPDGLKPVILGATRNTAVVVPGPAGLVTVTVPVRAPSGTVTFSEVAVTRLTGAVTFPLNVTAVAPTRFVPVIVTVAPTGAAAGVKPVGRGVWNTTSSAALVAVPSAVVTLIRPDGVPAGARKRTKISEVSTMKVAGIVNAPTFTVGRPRPALRLAPKTETTVSDPAMTDAGSNPSMRGRTRNEAAETPAPPAVVTEIGPVVAPLGTTALSDVAVTAVGVTGIPLKRTWTAVSRPVPVTVTSVPTVPPAGVNPLITGSGCGRPSKTRRNACVASYTRPAPSHTTTGRRAGDGPTAIHGLKPGESGPLIPPSLADPTPISTQAVPLKRATQMPAVAGDGLRSSCDHATIGWPSAPISTVGYTLEVWVLKSLIAGGPSSSHVVPLNRLTRIQKAITSPSPHATTGRPSNPMAMEGEFPVESPGDHEGSRLALTPPGPPRPGALRSGGSVEPFGTAGPTGAHSVPVHRTT